MTKELIVLAGGFGTRLKCIVPDLPKPMAPINNTPLLKLQLDHWIKQGYESFIFLLFYKPDPIVFLLSDASKTYGSNVKIRWIIEDEPLGTGGSVANAINHLKLTGTILVTNADTWLENGLNEISSTSAPAILVKAVSDMSRYGSVICNAAGRVTSFIEKSTNPEFKNIGLINAGLYKLSVDAFINQSQRAFSLEHKILPELAQSECLRAVVSNTEFFDIGIPEDYQRFCTWYGSR